MPNETKSSVIDQEVTRLEEQVTILLKTIDSLMKENKSLRAQQGSHSTERAAMIERNDMVRNRVEAIVTRLKSLENSA